MQIKHKTGRWLAALAAALFGFAAQPAHADLLKQIASIQGVRTNQLLGYGLMVGLDGTGDQTTQAPFTAQSMQSLLSQMGIQVPPGITPQLRNSAAVMVTAQLPAFAQAGQLLDITVSSIGTEPKLSAVPPLASPLMRPLNALRNFIFFGCSIARLP